MFNNVVKKIVSFMRLRGNIWYIYRGHIPQCNKAHALQFWVSKAIDRHSEYVILIAFPRRQSYPKARRCYICRYIACLVHKGKVIQG